MGSFIKRQRDELPFVAILADCYSLTINNGVIKALPDRLLRRPAVRPTSLLMEEAPTPRKWRDRPEYRVAMLCLGWMLLLSAPVIGALPGPGFLIVFPLGLAIILKHSLWAKQRFARFTRANPEYGGWINWAMGRAKGRGTPDFPPIRRDIMHLFRRDDIGNPMA